MLYEEGCVTSDTRAPVEKLLLLKVNSNVVSGMFLDDSLKYKAVTLDIRNELIKLATSVYDGKRFDLDSDKFAKEVTAFISFKAAAVAYHYGLQKDQTRIKIAATSDDRIINVVKEAIKGLEPLISRGASTNEFSAYLQYQAMRIHAELLRVAARISKGFELSSEPLDALAKKAGSNMPFSVKYAQLEEVLEAYRQCLLTDVCSFREVTAKFRDRFVTALLEGMPIRCEVLEELTRERNLIGVKPSDDFFVKLYTIYAKAVELAYVGKPNPNIQSAIATAMEKHIMKAEQIPSGLTMEEYLSRRSINKDKLNKAKDATFSEVSQELAQLMNSMARKHAQHIYRYGDANFFADVVYFDQLAHLYTFFGSPDRTRVPGLSKFTSYSPAMPEKPSDSGALPWLISSELGKMRLKREIRRLYMQVVDPIEYVEGEEKYYNKLLDIIDYFYRKFPELNRFMAKLMGNPFFTGEASATVQVGDRVMQVSYKYTAIDFLEFVTVRSLVKDEESREKLVDGFLSLMDGLQVVNEKGEVVDVKMYVESKGVSWDNFKETLRKGLLESVKVYAGFIESGSGSALAKHIYFRESVKSSGSFFDYWLLRLSREFGVLMYEYYTETKFTGKLTDIRSRVKHGAVNTTKYMRSALRLRATIKDLVHEHSELLRSSGLGKDAEGHSLGDRVKLWLGDKLGSKVSMFSKWYTEVMKKRDRFEEEMAEELLKDAQARATHRFEVETSVLLPDLAYENLREIDRDFVDKVINTIKKPDDLDESKKALS